MNIPENEKVRVRKDNRELHLSGYEAERYCTPHSTRHTFAARCIENGMAPQVLKIILGHATLSMTMDLYSHVLPDIKAEQMEKVAEAF